MKKILGYIIMTIIGLFFVAVITCWIIVDPTILLNWIASLAIGFGIILLLHKAYEWIKGE